jgi:hypothetical protein
VAKLFAAKTVVLFLADIDEDVVVDDISQRRATDFPVTDDERSMVSFSIVDHYFFFSIICEAIMRSTKTQKIALKEPNVQYLYVCL